MGLAALRRQLQTWSNGKMQRGAGEAWQEACSNLTELRSGAWAAGLKLPGALLALGTRVLSTEPVVCCPLPKGLALPHRANEPRWWERCWCPQRDPCPHPWVLLGWGRALGSGHRPQPPVPARVQHLSSSGYLTCSKCCTQRNLDVIFLCLHVNVGRCCPD